MPTNILGADQILDSSGNPLSIGGSAALVQDWEFIGEFSGSAVSSISSTFWAAGDYDEIEVSISDLEVNTALANVGMRISTDGSTFDSGASDYAYATDGGTAGGVSFSLGSNAASSVLIFGNLSNTAGNSSSGFFRWLSAGSTGDRPQLVGLGSFIDNGGDEINLANGGRRATDSAVRGIQLIVDSGNMTGKFVVRGRRNSSMLTGSIPLNLGNLREIVSNDIPNTAADGGVLTLDTTPSYGRVNGATDKALRVNWVAGNVDEVQFPPTFVPPDLDETADMEIHILARMSGATDTPTIDIQVFDGIGDTEMGGAAGPLASVLASYKITIANADISGYSTGVFNISLVPGAHATDAIELYSAWIEYKRKAV